MKSQTPRQKLGKRLARLRVAAGLTQRDVAQTLDFSSAQFVSNWERGLSYPPDDALPKIARIVKRPAKELITITYVARMQELARERVELTRRYAHA